MTVASLEALPLELLSFVAEYLTAQETFALSMVNKNLFAGLQSKLYSTIDVQFDMETPNPLLQLLRTLLDKTWLGHHFFNISLPGLGSFVDYIDAYVDTPALPEASILPSERLARLIGAIGVNEDHACAWFNAIQNPNADDMDAERRRDWHVQSIHLDTVLALVVAISPNLVRLSIDTKWATSSHYLGTLVRACASRKNHQAEDSVVDEDSGFSGLRVTGSHRLREVDIVRGYDTIVEPPHTTDTLSWFYLPAIEHLFISIDNEDNFTWPLSATPQPLSLTSLGLDRLREPRLSSFLGPLVSLKRLTYNWFCQEDIRHCNTTADLSQLAASI
ncbi:hypothetical protein CC79DRAFT_1333102 [Sarocladium strictum]